MPDRNEPQACPCMFCQMLGQVTDNIDVEIRNMPDANAIIVTFPPNVAVVYAAEPVWCHHHEKVLVEKGGLLSPYIAPMRLEECCRTAIYESLRKLASTDP